MMKTRFLLLLFSLALFLSGTNALCNVQTIELSENRLSVGGKPFIVKGVCWSPVALGKSFPLGLPWYGKGWDDPLSADERATIIEDLQLMHSAGINTVRTYEPIVNYEALELLHNYQIFQIVPVLNFYKKDTEHIIDVVNRLKSHPSTLFWELGNEWNYNRLYSEGDQRLSISAAAGRLVEAATIIRSLDAIHPISTSYGEIPFHTDDSPQHPDILSSIDFQRLNEAVDIWGLNVYSQDTFKNHQGIPRARIMKELTGKPLYFSEYGADAFDTKLRRVNERAQAHATHKLTQEIVDDLAWNGKNGNVLGGTIFEFSDEWWKAPGSHHQQDDGGYAPGNGPFPDGVFNEEYWGLVTIDRQVRSAYFELAEIYQSLP